MLNSPDRNNKRLGLYFAIFLVWFIMNVRVAAGIGTTFERAIDGLVGVALLLAVIFLALEFFGLIRKDEEG